ncbi:SDR family oxidoreductase [Zhihengliuella sp.]|uniref:SDR family NAD(P)-dependent oxidoreductase n=1 Tax=Zhihengliuella sp. TaxID=1954483 RepID=UPI0028126547|nr:SDR family oxidoreductase [Zhihengliuella sp.]
MPYTLVTGGGRGIGAAVCRRLARDGHDVALDYVHDGEAAERVAADVRALGRTAVVLRADVADPGQVERLFAEAGAAGTLTGLVNNAGAATAVGPLAGLEPEAIRRDLEVNLYGAVLCAREAVRAFTADGRTRPGATGSAGAVPRERGCIVNLSSAAAQLGGPGTYVHYAAAKAGVEALTVGLAKEVGPLGIRVNAVSPGTVWTDFHADPRRPARMGETVPLGRAGEPDEIAGAVSWMLSADAAYANGSILKVAGGL